MQSTEGTSPPPPTVPPPPSAPAEPRTDNTIALAGLMVSVMGLVLSVVVLGGIVGFVGFVLCAIGLQRSRALDGTGKMLSIAGMVLGLVSIGLSVLGFLWIRDLIEPRETTVIDNIRSETGDSEHPPQADVDGIECGASNTGLVARATVMLTNRSDSDSRYTVTVEWDTEDGGTVDDTFTTDVLDVEESASFSTLDLSGNAVVDSCRVVAIDRPQFSFLP